MKIAVKILALLLIAAIAVCGFMGIEPFRAQGPALQVEFTGMPEAPESSGQLRQGLSEPQQLLYDLLAQAVEQCSPSIHLPTTAYSKEDFRQAAAAYYYDHPEVFWYDYAGTAIIIDSTGATISFTYHAAGEQLEQMRAEFSASLNALTASASGLTDDWSRALAVHDALVAGCDYDSTLSGENIHTAYGALCDSLAVCDGYARAFKCAMDNLGIPCYVVPGQVVLAEGTEPEAHAWNLVQLDGSWTSVDVTWDELDFGSSSAPAAAGSHAYFGLSDEELFANHTPAADDPAAANLPAAVSLSWYSRTGRSSADGSDILDTLASDLASSVGDGSATGCFELQLTSQQGQQDFFEGGYLEVLERANELLEDSGSSVSFSEDAPLRYYILSNPRGCYLFTCEVG